MSTVQTPAVILGTSALGEADLLVVMLTPQLGKVRAAARHARASKRRFAGGLPAGALGEASLARRREGALWRLDGFRSVAEVSGLGRDLERFAYVAYLCELTDILVVEPESDPARFAALAEAVGETLREGSRPAVLRRFELRLLDSLGLLPALDACCVCGDVDLGADAIAFETMRGGALCRVHAAAAPTIDPQVLSLARTLQEADDPAPAWEAASQAPTQTRRALRDLVLHVMRPQLRRPLRSLEFMAQIARPAGADAGPSNDA